MLTARLFGGLRVSIDGREVPSIPGLRPRSVLAYLLLDPAPHARVRLAGRFWPDVLDTSARASLRSALWTIREALGAAGGAGYLRASRSHVGLDPDLPRAVDTEQFARLAAAGDPASLERAVALGARPLLADLADEWVLDAQDRHRERMIETLERLAALAEERGAAAAAVRWTRLALEHDRLRESTHRDLMRRLDASGERAQALGAYARLREALAAELGIRPSEATRALARTLSGEAGPPGPGRSAAGMGAPPRPPPVESPILGRTGELAALRAAWDRACGGEGGVAIVAGPPGIGKTRLLAEAAGWARAAGGRAAVGSALDLEGAPPLSAWSEALRELLRVTDGPAHAAWPADLARLCPAVEAVWGHAPRDPSAAPDLERMRLFEAVVEMVSWCARDGPVILGLEDLHRADPASAALFGFLGRRLSGIRALVVVTRRALPRSPHLDAAADAVRERGRLHAEMTLGPLGEGDIAALVAGAAPAIVASAARGVAAAADGNPLVAREAARAASSGALPAEGLRGFVRAPLGRLGPAPRRLVALVAAAGRPLTRAETADLMGADAGGAAVDGVLGSGLLVMAEDRRLAFSHALIRAAVTAELEPSERAEAHHHLARVLARRPGRRAAEVARHHRRADEPEAALRYLVEAAQEARSLGALDEAAAYLGEAVTLAADDPARAAELLLLLADVHSWRADRAAMDRAYEEAEGILIRSGDESGLALAHAFRGRWLHTTLCYPAEALAASRRALELIERAGLDAPEARSLALCSAAWAESVAGDPAAVDALIGAARPAPGAAADGGLEAELEQARGMALMRSGAFREAGEVCERAADLARRAGRPDAAALSLLTAAAAAACAGDFERVLLLAERAARWPWAGVSLGLQMGAARAHALSRLGRHSEAVRAAEENAGRAAALEGGADEALARLDLGVVALAAGMPERAAESLRAALESPAPGIPRALARLRLAEALALAGEGEEAAGELQRVPFEPVGPADMPEAIVPGLSRLQGLIAARAGDRELADRRFTEAEEAWRRVMAASRRDGAFTAILVDLGRPPVAGLVEPERELERLAGDRRALRVSAETG